MLLLTRKHCPGVWHDALVNTYDRLSFAPHAATEYTARKFGLHGWQVALVRQWVRDKRRSMPCPV